MELTDCQVQKEKMELQDLLGLKVTLALQVSMVRQGLLVSKENVDL